MELIRKFKIGCILLVLPLSASANIFYDRDLLQMAPIEVFDRAIRAGVSPLSSANDSNGLGPLHLAAIYGRFDIVDLLLSNGADINGATVHGCPAIHSAAIQGSSEMLRYFVELGADLDSPICSLTDYSMSTLNEVDVVEKTRIAITAGADQSRQFRDGSNPYTRAASNRVYGVQLIKLLIELNPGAGLPYGGEVAKIAVENLNLEFMDYLMVNFPDEVLKKTSRLPLMFSLVEAEPFSDKGRKRRTEMLLLLMNAGLDINSTDATGRTLLHLVAAGDDPGLLQDIIDLGANPLIVDRSGQTAFEIASRGSLVGHPAYFALEDLSKRSDD